MGGNEGRGPVRLPEGGGVGVEVLDGLRFG